MDTWRKTQRSHRTLCSQLKRERDAAMTAAILNAETIREQRREFQATIAELSKQLATVRRENRILLNEQCKQAGEAWLGVSEILSEESC